MYRGSIRIVCPHSLLTTSKYWEYLHTIFWSTGFDIGARSTPLLRLSGSHTALLLKPSFEGSWAKKRLGIEGLGFRMGLMIGITIINPIS